MIDFKIDLEPLKSEQFNSLAWLQEHKEELGDANKLADLKWALRQLQAQLSADFEIKARQFKERQAKLHHQLTYQQADGIGITDLQDQYQDVSGRIHERLGASDLETFNRLIGLETRRASLVLMGSLVGKEAEWRRMAASFTGAIEVGDLDTAQALLESLDGLSGTIPSERKTAQLESMRQLFIDTIKNS